MIEKLLQQIIEKKSKEMGSLISLQQQYQAAMGYEDKAVAERIAAAEKKYDAKLALIQKKHQSFQDLISPTDDINRILALENNCEDDLFCIAHPEYLQKVKSRSLDENSYWDAVFVHGLELSQPPSPPQKDLNESELAEKLSTEVYNLPTLHREWETLSTEQRTAAENALQFIGSKTGERYDLKLLTFDEIMGLKKHIDNFTGLKPNEKLEHIIDLMYNIPSVVWNGLTSSDQQAILYARKRDINSAEGELQTATDARVKRLAAIALGLHPRMNQCNDQFRNYPLDVTSISEEKIYDTFAVEAYLLNTVVPQREPLFSRFVGSKVNEVLGLHRKIESVLSESEAKSLGVEKIVIDFKKARGYSELGKFFSPQYRRFLFRKIDTYLSTLDRAPETLKQKILHARQIPFLPEQPVQLKTDESNLVYSSLTKNLGQYGLESLFNYTINTIVGQERKPWQRVTLDRFVEFVRTVFDSEHNKMDDSARKKILSFADRKGIRNGRRFQDVIDHVEGFVSKLNPQQRNMLFR